MNRRTGIVVVATGACAAVLAAPAHALDWGWQSELGFTSASHGGTFASYYGDETNKGFTGGARARLNIAPWL